MSTYAVIDGSGLIVNRVVLDDPGGWQAPAGTTSVLETTTVYEIGGTYIAGVYTPPPPPPLNPPPSVGQITSRQFWTQLAVDGLISENEAVDALRGDIPNAIKQYINGLPANQRFVARMFFEATTFERDKRAISDTKACFSLTQAAIDLFFQHAAAL
jgi:hypothetical protein